MGNFGDKSTKCLSEITEATLWPRSGCTASPTLVLLRRKDQFPIFLTPPYTLPLVQMAHSSNVIINGGIFSSGQGDVHIRNEVLEFGMHNFGSVQNSILIDDPMKDLIPF